MGLFLVCLLGALSVLIQFVSLKRAMASKNYWEIKKSLQDLSCDTVVFIVASTGGVIGFYIAVMSSFVITVWLTFFVRGDFGKPEPRWFVWLKSKLAPLGKHF